MKLVRVAAAALNQTPLDWDANARNIRRAIADARGANAQLLCLPELAITGYGCEDAFYSRGVTRMAERVLAELLPDTQGMAVSVGLPVLHAGALFNASALVVDGELVGLAAKQHLAGDGLHYEPRWFKQWPDNAVATIRLAGSEVPIGDLLFDLDGFALASRYAKTRGSPIVLGSITRSSRRTSSSTRVRVTSRSARPQHGDV